AGLRKKRETVPVGNARAGSDQDLIGGNIQRLVVLGDGFTGGSLSQRVGHVNARLGGGVLQNLVEHFGWIHDSVLVHIAAYQVHDLRALRLQPVVQQVQRILRSAKAFRQPGDRKSTRLNSSHDQISYA